MLSKETKGSTICRQARPVCRAAGTSMRAYDMALARQPAVLIGAGYAAGPGSRQNLPFWGLALAGRGASTLHWIDRKTI